MSGLGDDEGEYNEGATQSYVAGKVVEVVSHQQFLGALAHHRECALSAYSTLLISALLR